MTRKLWILAGIGLLLVSCTRTRMPGAQGQTHWGKSCDTNADCGEQTDLSCICSVCMAECTQGDSCDLDGRQAQCFGPNAGAVKALCGASATASAGVCLETCESECGDGFRCADGACIPIEPEPQPMAGRGSAGSGTAGGGTAGRGTAGAGEQDGGSAQPMPMPVTIELVNNINQPISVQTKDCAGNPPWFRITSEDPVGIDPFGYCQADCATNPTGPQGCPAICLAPQFMTLEMNESIRYEWDGRYFKVDSSRFCSNHVALASGTPYEIEFCWSKTLPKEDIPGFPTPPPEEDVVCKSIALRHGELSTVQFKVTE